MTMPTHDVTLHSLKTTEQETLRKQRQFQFTDVTETLKIDQGHRIYMKV